MAHWFHIEFYNSVSHMATVETDCSGLCRVTIKETMPLSFPLLSLSSMLHSVLPLAVFKNQSINPEEDNTHVVTVYLCMCISMVGYFCFCMINTAYSYEELIFHYSRFAWDILQFSKPSLKPCQSLPPAHIMTSCKQTSTIARRKCFLSLWMPQNTLEIIQGVALCW